MNLCEECFPNDGAIEILTIVPLTPCDVCGMYDDRYNNSGQIVHAYRSDPRNVITNDPT